MKVGDLVKFYNASWVGPVPKVYEGCGLVEEAYNDGTFEIYWPSLAGSIITTRTLGKEALMVVSESR